MADNSSSKPDPGAKVAEAAKDAHEARTSLQGDRKANGLASGVEVDARLDNRTGADRPPVVKFPAVPQQIDGPDVQHQAEFTRAYLAGADERVGNRLGMFSAGPHGLSEDSVRQGKDRADESGGKPAPDGETGADPNQPVGERK